MRACASQFASTFRHFTAADSALRSRRLSLHLLLLLALGLGLASSPARAQLTFNPYAGMGITQPIYGTLDFLNEIEPELSDNGAMLVGDINFNLEPGHNRDYFNIGFGRGFHVGPLPVQASNFLFNDWKWVIGGGTRTAPDVEVKVSVDILAEVDGNLVSVPELNGWASQSLSGNGFQLFQGILGGQDFILAPGYDYRLSYMLEVTADTSKLTVEDPPTVVTLEFGGITNYQGIGAGLEHQVVAPEPSSLAMAGCGLASFLGVAGRRKRFFTRYRAQGAAPRRATVAVLILAFVAAAAASARAEKIIHFVYLSPADVPYRAEFEAGIENAARTLQTWFPQELSGKTFPLHADIVEWYQTPHDASWYQTDPSSPAFSAGRFWESATADAFALTGGAFHDPDDIWVLYLDVDPLEGQYTGGTSSVGLMPRHDLEGLIGESNEPISRWIGGAGHEMGHALGLPHPPGSPGGPDDWSLMYYGYTTFPDTYLRDADRAALLTSGYFIPEPSSLAMAVCGMTSLLALAKRRRACSLRLAG